MHIIFHNRQAILANDFKDVATEKLHSIDRFSVKIDRIEVETILEPNPSRGKLAHRVAIRSSGSGPFIHADEHGRTYLAAFDKALKSIVGQIRNIHEKRRDYDRESLRDLKIVNE